MTSRNVLLGLITAIAMGANAAPATAQLGRLGDLAKGAQKVKKVADLKVTESEERQIGQQVSDKLVQEFGVFQDANVTRYVALVGTVLAQASSRPKLDWQFVVLDTDGVNAFAAPGGLVHVTRGLLGLLKNEAELGCVLAHELTHVTEKHTVNAIQQGDTVKLLSEETTAAGGMAPGLVTKFADAAYKNVINNAFSRKDEGEADEKGIALCNKVGYAPSGLATALGKLAERNQGAAEPNGLFATHPQMKERIANIQQEIAAKKLGATATVQARYAKYITFNAKPVSAIAQIPSGTRGLAGGDGKKPAEKTAPAKDAAKKEEEKKSGGSMLSKLRPSGGAQAQQSQTVSSAGARGVSPDRDAVGGPVKTRVPVKIGPADLAAFQKGIVA